MSDVPLAWHSTVYGVVVHPSQPRILLVPDDGGRALPHVRLEDRLWPRHVHPVVVT